MSISNSGAIYTELGSLLDDRLAVLAQINQDLATEVLEAGTYHARYEDAFPGVTHAQFKEHYDKRDENTLSQSMMTNNFVLLRHLFKTILEEETLTPFHDKLKLVVNVHPYSNLTDEERSLLVAAIQHNLGGVAEVELVNMAVSQLTPNHCRENYRFMVMYDWGRWMEIQTSAFHMKHIPEVAVIAPAIYHAGSPSEDEKSECLQELRRHFPDAKSVFDGSEKFTRMLINLHLIDVWYFSVVSDFSQTVHQSTLPDIASLMGTMSGEGTNTSGATTS